MSNLACFVRTIRYLRPSQLAWRAAYRVLRPLETQPWYDIARRTERHARSLEFVASPVVTPCDACPDPAIAEQRLEELREGKLTLLNRQRPFRGGSDWGMSGSSHRNRLWVHTLHYHGWLLDLIPQAHNSQGAEVLASGLQAWLDHCQLGAPGFTHFAWNSYAIASRLDNWRQLDQQTPASFWDRRPQLRNAFIESFGLQGSYLYRHLEWDLRGNHLLRDALGLANAGRKFKGGEACRWLKAATEIAVDQAREQILEDGGHFERSPMYHLEQLRDLLKLTCLITDEPARRELDASIRKMSDFSAWIQHPDGRVPQLNDAAQRSSRELLQLAECQGACSSVTVPRGGRHFEDSGIVVWHGSPWTLFFDVGEVGPDYQPGHAHADTLTIDVSFAGKRLFVDPGCFDYDQDETRRYDRATSSHNTVCVDDQNSSEVWHIFRVGRRARPVDVQVQLAHDGLHAAAAHSGYRHLAGTPEHRREIRVGDHQPLQLVDEVTGSGRHRVSGGFLLDPRWKAVRCEKSAGWRISDGEHHLRVELDSRTELSTQIVSRPVHPDYGIEYDSQRIQWSCHGELPYQVRVLVREITETTA